MLKLTHELEVIVSRVNEGLNDPSFERLRVKSVNVGEDDRLNLMGDGWSKHLVGWDRFEVTRHTTTVEEV
jgi:hypothetical protein